MRIVFSVGDAQYELQKQFLKGAAAQLTGGGRTLRGENAEESLRQLLGSRPAGSRGAEIADLGIWPLLMVSQGDSRRPVQHDLNEDGRGRLHERLSREIGVAAISPAGQQVMALAEAEYGRYFTATGQEGRSLRDARVELRTAEGQLAAATAALQRQEQTALALASNQQELGELEARRVRAKHEADAARDRAEAAQVAGRLVATAQGVLDTNLLKVSSVARCVDFPATGRCNDRAADERSGAIRARAHSSCEPAVRVGTCSARGRAAVRGSGETGERRSCGCGESAAAATA